MNKKDVIIIRGPSGSGKTTLAKKLCDKYNNAIFHEADQFFYNKNGKYNFNYRYLDSAHNYCRFYFKKSLQDSQYDAVIVSNTNILLDHIKDYLDLARYHNIIIYKTKGPWVPEILEDRNKHTVPLKTISRQISNYEPHSNEIEYED